MKNYTMLRLLKKGCAVEFPSGYRLRGDPLSRYIEVSTPFGPDGLWNLDRDGLTSAIKDAEDYEREERRERGKP